MKNNLVFALVGVKGLLLDDGSIYVTLKAGDEYLEVCKSAIHLNNLAKKSLLT